MKHFAPSQGNPNRFLALVADDHKTSNPNLRTTSRACAARPNKRYYVVEQRLSEITKTVGCFVLTFAACGDQVQTPHEDASITVQDAGADLDASAPMDACAPGARACPYVIETFPFSHSADTTTGAQNIDTYDCAPSTNESGPERYYRLALTEPGIVRAIVDDIPGDEIDVDLHLLDSARCLSRDNIAIELWLRAGIYELVVDTWVNDADEALVGPYTLDVTFSPAAEDRCATVPTEVRMFWSSCAPSIPDCIERDGERYLATPATGPVVYEAHLVTAGEDFGGSWPTSFTDRIERHYQSLPGGQRLHHRARRALGPCRRGR